MSKLVKKLRFQLEAGRRMHSQGFYIELSDKDAAELLAHIERLEAQLAEAKSLYLTERTEGLFDQEQQEGWDDAESYFDRMMELTAKQTAEADKGV